MIRKSKHKLGYTSKEVEEIIKGYYIEPVVFWERFGVNTCSVHPDTGEPLYYKCDIVTAIRCCMEGRHKYFWEWD